MRWEVTLLPVNDYIPEELIQDLTPEHYLMDDAGNCIIAAIVFRTESPVFHLIQFLFQTEEIPREVYKDDENYVLDLSPMKDRIISVDKLELLYPDWLKLSGRENTMNEYGMLLDFIGFARTKNRRNLVMTVCRRPDLPQTRKKDTTSVD